MNLYIDGIFVGEIVRRTLHQDRGYCPDYKCWRFLLSCGVSILIPTTYIYNESYRNGDVRIDLSPINPMFP